MITSLGTFLRRLRLVKGEILKDMAESLGVSSAFLSAVENGKKKMPEAWYEKLRNVYGLDDDQDAALRQAVLESSEVVELNLKNASRGNRQLAISFARQFDSLDEETSQRILNILNKRKED